VFHPMSARFQTSRPNSHHQLVMPRQTLLTSPRACGRMLLPVLLEMDSNAVGTMEILGWWTKAHRIRGDRNLLWKNDNNWTTWKWSGYPVMHQFTLGLLDGDHGYDIRMPSICVLIHTKNAVRQPLASVCCNIEHILHVRMVWQKLCAVVNTKNRLDGYSIMHSLLAMKVEMDDLHMSCTNLAMNLGFFPKAARGTKARLLLGHMEILPLLHYGDGACLNLKYPAFGVAQRSK